MTLTGRAEPKQTHGLTATASYFGIAGMKAELGRLYGEDDDKAGARAVVVLNHRFWAATLGSDANVVGTNLILNGRPFEVIGVTAPLWEPWQVDYYLPLGRQNGGLVNRAMHGPTRIVGRLKPGVTVAAAKADLDAIMQRLAESDPGPESSHRSAGEFWAEDIAGDLRSTLLVLMGAAGLVLLIACANVASLLLARNLSRTGELALRKAIGAGRFRLVRQMLTENIVLAGVGGAAGVALAYLALPALVALAPAGIPRLAEASLDWEALGFACAATVLGGLLAGLAPVVSAGNPDLAAVIKEGGRLGGGRRRQSMRNALVVAEVALTFVLAFASGLLIRSLLAAQRSNPGYDPRGALAFSLRLPGAAYKSEGATESFYARLLPSLRAIPGVTGASMVFCGPGAGDCGDWWYSVVGRPAPDKNEVPLMFTNTADAGYFAMMRVPVLEGREFTEQDRSGPPVAIINRRLAREWWPNEPAVGHQIKFGGPYRDGPLLQIVGVVANVKQFERDTAAMPELYQPYSQQRPSGMTMVIRAGGSASAAIVAVRERVRALDPNLPLQDVATLEDSLHAGLARRRFSTLLLTVFAGLAMLLAAIGIYGLLSYWVTVREGEIAVRLALGARPGAILRWTSAQAMRLTAVGIGLGLAGGWAAAGTLQAHVFGIPARNPQTMLVAAVAVSIIAMLAAAIPARRAAGVDPGRKLHQG
jgi:putative ABC transport system permease protein